MQVSFALFADAANLSQEGKLNILGVFDAVQVGALPTVHRRASLVVHLKGDEKDAGVHSLTLRWLSPTGEELWNTQGQVEVQSAPPSGEKICSVRLCRPMKSKLIGRASTVCATRFGAPPSRSTSTGPRALMISP